MPVEPPPSPGVSLALDPDLSLQGRGEAVPHAELDLAPTALGEAGAYIPPRLRREADESVRYAQRIGAGASTTQDDPDSDVFPAWPDLVVIDGGRGQLQATIDTLAEIGVTDGRWSRSPRGRSAMPAASSYYLPGRQPFRMEPRDPALYFVQRLRDEAHRFAIGTHRAKRSRELVRSPLDEIEGIGPRRKRALAHAFRDGEGDRARLARRPRPCAGRQRRDGEGRLRFLPPQR